MNTCSTKEHESDATAMRRKCAMSLYEMTTDSNKGPLLLEHGVLRALSGLCEVGGLILTGQGYVRRSRAVIRAAIVMSTHGMCCLDYVYVL